MILEIRGLGLAAYLRMQTGEVMFIKFENGKFIFESEKDENHWRVQYINSCCYRHDQEVMALRVFKQQDKSD